MNFKKIKAVAYLAFHITLHFFKKLFRIGQRHKTEFIKSYKADRIFSISPLRRDQMPDYSRCYHCKLCDTECPELASNPHFLAPSYIVGAFSRSLTDFSYFNTDNSCESCKKCEEICPQNIPIQEIIDFMKEGKAQIAA